MRPNWTDVGSAFFFQAEGGIRDIGVTGVQTCALPIFFVVRSLRPLAALLAVLAAGLAACSSGPGEPTSVSDQTLRAIDADAAFTWEKQQIGRASGRERV